MKKILVLFFIILFFSPAVFAERIYVPEFFDLLRTGSSLQVQQAIDKRGANVNGKNIMYHVYHSRDYVQGDQTYTAVFDACGHTALQWACIFSDDPQVIKLLIEKGAKVNTTDYSGNTPLMMYLHFHAKNPDIEVVKLFIEKGANVNARDSRSETALTMTLSGNNPEIVKFLVEKGADKNVVNVDKTNLLMLASRYYNEEIVKIFLDAGINVNSSNSLGYTPLMFAAKLNKDPRVAELLIKSGANIKAKNNYGETAIQLAALNNKNPLVISVLGKGCSQGQIAFYQLQNPTIQKLKATNIYWEILNTYIADNGPEKYTSPYSNLDSAIGYTKEMLVEKLGAPSNSYKLNDKTEILNYSGSNRHWVEGTWSGNDYGSGYHASGTEGRWEGNDYEDIYIIDKGIVTDIKRRNK